MPELPEVETVRRGLAPAMEGARFKKVEVRDRATCAGRCRRISSKRLEGKTVDGLGRRAKYLLADLSSGDVLVMHLGMSGSFRVGKDAKARSPASIITSAPRARRTTMWCFTCRTARPSPSTIRAASAR